VLPARQKWRTQTDGRRAGRAARGSGSDAAPAAEAGSKGPSLRQQQCAGCRGNISKMHLAHALIACSDGNPLPTPEWVGGLLTMSSSRGPVRPSTDCGPGRCVVAVVAHARASLCRGRRTRQRDIALPRPFAPKRGPCMWRTRGCAADVYAAVYDHRSARAQAGVLTRRAGPLDRAAARICKEVAARVASHVAHGDPELVTSPRNLNHEHLNPGSRAFGVEV